MSSVGQAKSIMFNACDACRPWSAKRTAILVTALDSAEVPFEFLTLGSIVVLGPKESRHCYEYFALFFEDQKPCVEALRRLKIKCELTVTSVTGRLTLLREF